MAIKRKTVTVGVNGAEYMELEARAREATLSIPAYVRTVCGLPPWISRGREREGQEPRAVGQVMALDRKTVTMYLTEPEWTALNDARREASVHSLQQYIRTRCGFDVRETSQPGTDARYQEEDDAWNRLKRLGLDPAAFFPEA